MSGRNSILKAAAAGWLLFVLVVVLFAIRQGPQFDSSIMALLPKSEQQPLVQHATEQMAGRFSKRLILLLSGESEAEVRRAVSSLAGQLSALSVISNVTWRVDDDEMSRHRNELYPYRFSVLDPGTRERLLSGNYEQIQQRALLQLYSPLSMGGGSLVQDPFGLFSELSLNRPSDLNLQVSNGLLQVTGSDQPTYMLMATLEEDPFSPGVQGRVLGIIESEQDQLQQSAITIRMSGMLLHAAAGTEQASREISTIGLGSLLGIVLIMLLTFRQAMPLVLMLFPVVVGCVTAAAVTLLVFGRVHLVTFAFGAGLVGVSIDYALHFICERSRSSSERILQKILPGLLLGLFSSAMAYAAQALTPFPGLRQMAIFSVVGLCASWITVVTWFPLLTKYSNPKPMWVAGKLDRLRNRFPRVEGNPILTLVLLCLFALSITLLWNGRTVDDIRLLQTSPASLLKQEQHVQKMLGVTSTSQFLLIRGDTLEQCLRKEERLANTLDQLKAEGLVGGYQSLSSVLPSLQRQAENMALVQTLYDQRLNAFFDMLNISDQGLSDARISLERAERRQLTPDKWVQHQGSESWADLIVMQSADTAATVIRFTGPISDEAKARLVVLSQSETDVSYIDRVQSISDLMGSYRSQIVTWVMLAYLCVMAVLLLRYKRQVWRILMPPLLASIFTLGALVQLEQGVNLFHLMALILVLGIGLDMGIFLMETQDAAHTWLAVSLSTYTSLLAFGLLALSKTPVLHHFGLTVLIGLAFVWLLVPVMRKKPKEILIHE